MGILETIHSSNDIKKLKPEELAPLCREIRDFLIESVSRTGGHLASNLGTVELTVALHRVYDTSRDRLVFDVGHQSYTHKIITGRRELFSTLRQYGGLSGFPKPYEREDDAFIAGHASNSVSVALGMAKARTQLGLDYDVVAVLGDGALTGGLAYEGLAAAAASGEPLVIILNDNNMSIDPNVGGISRQLQRMRVKPSYISFKRAYREAFSQLPALYQFNHRIKERIKDQLLPGNMFSAMDLNYIGPVDGHDAGKLESVIAWARELREPVIVHVLTKKGKGCSYAEQHPELYHGVGPFDPKNGRLQTCAPCFSERFGQYLGDCAQKDGRVTAITAAMASGTGLDQFAARFPKRFFDTGIAEGHAAAMAAGMAKQGAIPVFAVYASFLQRAYDMLIHDVALQNLHVVFGVDRAGIVGSDGETHHGIFDVSFLRTVPGMTILCPASFEELEKMLHAALFEIEGPVAVRYPRGGEGKYSACSHGTEEVLRAGTDVTIVAYGMMINEALEAVDTLERVGISAELVKINAIRGNAFPETMASLRKTGRFIASEEICAAGCVGETILACASAEGRRLKGAALLNLGEGIVAHGDRARLLRDHGVDAQAIVECAEKMCAGEQRDTDEEDQTGSARV